MSKHTPGPWVFGEWDINPEDREAQRRGEPFWTLKKGDNVLTRGPIGRKARETDAIIRSVGYDCDGLDCSEADQALICTVPDLLYAARETFRILTYREDTLRALELLMAAITKAEGDK